MNYPGTLLGKTEKLAKRRAHSAAPPGALKTVSKEPRPAHAERGSVKNAISLQTASYSAPPTLAS